MSIRIPRPQRGDRKTAAATTRKLTAAPHFTPESLAFLKQLKRNNRREWFNPRKQTFLEVVRAPMIEVCAALVRDFESLASEFVRPPEKCIMRVYRDTRFSKDKKPYKTNVAAWFAPQGMEKVSGAGFYLHLSPDELLIAGGCYMPEPEQLKKIRAHIAANYREMEQLMRVPALRRSMTEFDGLKLTRTPKGYAPDHPAAELLRCRQFGFSASLPPETALSPQLLPEIRKRFRALLPLVRFLNAPLLPSERPAQMAAFRLS